MCIDLLLADPVDGAGGAARNAINPVIVLHLSSEQKLVIKGS